MQFLNISNVLKYLYWTGLGVTIISIPIFNVGMSIGAIWLVSISLIYFITSSFFDLNLKSELNNPFKSAFFLVPLAFYLMHVIGLLYTEDLAYALKDLRIKSPLIIIPFTLTYLPKVDRNLFNKLLWLFSFAVVFSVVTSLMVYWEFVTIPYDNIRDITVKFITRISHIRLALSIDFALIIVFYLSKNSWLKKGLAFLISIPLLYFLWITQSITGIIILLFLIGFSVAFYIFNSSQSKIKLLVAGSFILTLFGVLFYVNNIVSEYYHIEDSFENLKEKSALGNLYYHNPKDKSIENQHYIWINIAQEELKTAWNKRSEFDASGKDKKNQELYMTLLRYMTSKGLTKDDEGINSLSNFDISQIENGTANAFLADKSPIKKRIEAIIFELDNYSRGGNPSGNSVTQRLEFWKAGWLVFKRNPWLGCGTGDIETELASSYIQIETKLDKKHQLRAHNQYLSSAATLGIIGLILFLTLVFFPIILKSNRSNFLYLIFFIISALSFITEDTLETHAGVSFIAFFYVFFNLKERTKSATLPNEISK